MALHYKQKSPDKLSLIKSAGLLNAALVRNPRNASLVETHLKDLCSEIVKCAKAKKQNVDLIQESNKIAEMIKEMRKFVETELSKIQRYISQEADNEKIMKYEDEKIILVSNLQNQIRNDYTEVMSQISKTSEEIMGKAPCNFAVVGMGSLARNEITPYSDFEHVIVLENGCEKQNNYFKILEYFRWFSVIFHVIIINLGETILPSLDIEVLKDWFYDRFTKRGISFDGMMPHACKFPLGRQKHTENKPWSTELIKPVDKMLDYLSFEENLKNGYHLGDILTKTCFIYGFRELSIIFCHKVKTKLKLKSYKESLVEVSQFVKRDLSKFSVRKNISDLRNQDEIDIKQVFYRCTTLFIAALGRIHKVMEYSSCEIVKELFTKQVISKQTKHKLLYAIALACEIRLRYYMRKQSQTDKICFRLEGGERNAKIFELILGAQNTIKYFQIAYCLQYMVADQLNLIKKQFFSNPIFLNIFLCCALEFDKRMMLLVKKVEENMKPKYVAKKFDTLIEILESDICSVLPSSTSKVSKWNSNQKAKILKETGHKLLEQFLADDAYYFFKCSYSILDEFLSDEKSDLFSKQQRIDVEAEKIKADSLLCQFRCVKEDEICLQTALDALEMYTRLSKSGREDNKVSEALYFTGLSYLTKSQYEAASTFLKKSIQIKIRVTGLQSEKKEKETALISYKLGICLQSIGKNKEAVKCLEKSKKFFEQFEDAFESEFAEMLNCLGISLMSCGRFNYALYCFYKSKRIYKKIDFIDKIIEVSENQKKCFQMLKNLNSRKRSLYQKSK